MRKTILALLLGVLFATQAAAQSSPGLIYGQVPTAAQWNSYFAAKQDTLGYTPLNRAGDSMLGRLSLFASSASGAGLNVGVGTAPTTPANGDLWLTTSGIFYRNGGVTVGPLLAGSGTSYAAGTGLAVTFPSGVVTYALATDSTAWSFIANASSGSAVPTPVAITSLTVKATPTGSDIILIADAAASNGWKQATLSTLPATGVTSFNTQTGAVTYIRLPQGRLTLQANTPVMTTSQTGVGTLRYDCYLGGNQVPYYTGTADAFDTISSCEVTDAMVSAASAGQVVSGQVYDVWWVHSGANRICVAMSASGGGGGGWASDGGSSTTRGSTFTVLDFTTRPYVTNANAIANCFNGSTNYGSVAANRGTYLGTILATANGQTSHTFGSAASGGGKATFGVWNAYNRVSVGTIVTDSAATHTVGVSTSSLTSGTLSNAEAADGSASNAIQAVVGIIGDAVDFTAQASISVAGGTSTNSYIGIGVNSMTTGSVGTRAGQASGNAGNLFPTLMTRYLSPNLLGSNTYTALEGCDNSTNCSLITNSFSFVGRLHM